MTHFCATDGTRKEPDEEARELGGACHTGARTVAGQSRKGWGGPYGLKPLNGWYYWKMCRPWPKHGASSEGNSLLRWRVSMHRSLVEQASEAMQGGERGIELSVAAKTQGGGSEGSHY